MTNCQQLIQPNKPTPGLADSLTIGPTLRLIDGSSPVKATDSSGNFCVLMPWRCVAEDATEAAHGNATVPGVAA